MKKWLLTLPFTLTSLTGFSATTPEASQTAYFAMGCFWCAEADMDKVHGVTSTTVGYMGGTQPNPTYDLVSSGKTHYLESIRVRFNPSQISYKQLLIHFWHNVDPTRDDGQFCDTGKQYAPRIFYTDNQQKIIAEQSKRDIAKQLSAPIKVAITPATTFYPAEQYHQNYYQKNPIRYKFYRFQCGRDSRLNTLWGTQK